MAKLLLSQVVSGVHLVSLIEEFDSERFDPCLLLEGEFQLWSTDHCGTSFYTGDKAIWVRQMCHGYFCSEDLLEDTIPDEKHFVTDENFFAK